MTTRPLAFLVHLLTASGALLALLALIAATRGQWTIMFLWLGAALAVDGIDGPLARALDTKRSAPYWDGDLLDLVVDYLTYVFVPAYALVFSGILPAPFGLAAALLIVLTAVIYFADVRIKTADHSFAGFPAVWQGLLLVLFTLSPPTWLTLAIIAALAAAQFSRLTFIHPVRTRRWRWLNLPVTVAWVVFAAWSVWADLDPPMAAKTGLAVTSIWLAAVGIVMQLLPRRNSSS